MTRTPGISRFLTQIALASLVVAGASGCATKYRQVPPRVDLQSYGRVAIVMFEGRGADTTFAGLATQRFAEQVLASQPGFELLELRDGDPLVRGFRQSGDASALAQALGRERNVSAVFLGQLVLSDLKPSVQLSASSIRGHASVNAELSVRLLATGSGGTVWRASSGASGSVGGVSISRGLPSIAVRDPEETYGELVRLLVGGTTRDFRPTLIRVSIERANGRSMTSGMAGGR